MIFLVEYNRAEGKLISLCAFDASQLPAAQAAKLELELSLHRRGLVNEVVFLQAEDEAELRRSYRRYFEDLRTLLASALQSLASPEPRDRKPLAL